MTGNTLTTNPITGTNAYANGAYGTTPQGFWGTTTGIVGSTPFGFNTPVFQPQVMNPIGQVNPFTAPMIQQPGFVGLVTTPGQTGIVSTLPFGLQNTLQTVLQTTPQQVVNTILQTTPPQVLPYILNALACQQACQQVLAQNPQAVLGIHPQTITQPFPGYGTTNHPAIGFGGLGTTTIPFVSGYLPAMQQGCVGCTPGMQQWNPTVAFQGGFGQVLPQQPWFNTTYGTW
jgi:hypothetical protein